MFPNTEPEEEPTKSIFISFEEQFGHLFKSNIGI